MAQLFYMPFRPAFDNNLKSLPGAQAWFTLAGTNTPSAPYQDEALTTPYANPVVANAVGRFPSIYLDDAVTYRVRIYDADAVVGVDSPIEDYDPYQPITGVFDNLALVNFLQTGAGAVERTALSKMRETISVKDFGAVGDGVADDTAAIQAAITAAAGKDLYFPGGAYKVTSTLVMNTQASAFRGAGHFATRIEMQTLNTPVISVTAGHCHVRDLSVHYNGTPIAGASGILATGTNYFYCSNVMVRNSFDGFQLVGMANVFLSNVAALDFENTGIYCRDVCLDVYVDKFYLNCGTQVRGALGCIRLLNQCEAVVFANGEVLQGVYSLVTAAAANTPGNRPAYCKFTNIYFDSSANGALIDKTAEMEFHDCWFSNRPNKGAVLSNCDGVKFIGGGALNCGTHGVLVNTTALRTMFDGFSARGNSQVTTNTSDGIVFAAGTTDFIVRNCILGGGAAIGFPVQRYGCVVNAGASDRYIISGNLVSGNGTGGVFDGGTGVNKQVANNY